MTTPLRAIARATKVAVHGYQTKFLSPHRVFMQLHPGKSLHNTCNGVTGPDAWVLPHCMACMDRESSHRPVAGPVSACHPPRNWLHAGKAHDVMALKCRGADSPLNFAMDEYAELLPMLAKLSKARLRPACPCQLPDQA